MPLHTVTARHASANERITVLKYFAHTGMETSEVFSSAAVDFLDRQRRQCARELEGLNAQQKALRMEKNVEAARWFRGAVAETTKRLRAVRLWLGWISGGGISGDAPWTAMYYWPTDFPEQLDQVWGELVSFADGAQEGEVT